MFSEVDLTRPALARQVSDLRQAHTEFSKRVDELMAEIQQAGEVVAIRTRVTELLAALRDHRKQEIDLIQESVTTDLGAGD
jgi:hypothetical protein